MAATSDAAETVREFATRFIDGSFADAAGLLTEDGRDAVLESFPDEFQDGPMDAEDALERYWWGLYGQYGDSGTVGAVSVTDDEATVEFEFADGTETARVTVDDDGVADVSFDPEYEVPDYVDEGAFDERDVTVDAGDVDLDGRLAVPDGTGPFPGVVLVHGAGIHDPDGTVGASKILRDLAWGLASERVATLRYQKRLDDHEVDDENFTVDAVVVDDAMASVDELAAADAVAEEAVFVAGHSQGGMCAPRIADRHGGVAGTVILDGPADPTVDPDDVSVMRYSIEPDGDLDEEQEAQLEAQHEAIRRIADGDYDDDDIIMGKPGTWHRSADTLDPLGTVSDLDLPVFVAKSGRADEDLQPELVEFLHDRVQNWREADLADGSRVAFYEGVCHYLQDGPSPVTMSRLYFGGNVADYVVADLAEWIHDAAPR